MIEKIKYHPVLTHAEAFKSLSRPLLRFDITYFSHVTVTAMGQFSAVSNHPEFHRHYLENHYYNADIHQVFHQKMGTYILWDDWDYFGLAESLNEDAEKFEIYHTFTLVEEDIQGRHFYHFSTNKYNCKINQIYLQSIDFLKLYILYFKDQIKNHPELFKAYTIQWKIDDHLNLAEYKLNTQLKSNQNSFLKDIQYSKNSAENFFNTSKRSLDLKTLFNTPLQEMRLFLSQKKYSLEFQGIQFQLSKREIEIMLAMVRGQHAGEIATTFHLKQTTVESYIQNIKNKFGLTLKSELIAAVFESNLIETILL